MASWGKTRISPLRCASVDMIRRVRPGPDDKSTYGRFSGDCFRLIAYPVELHEMGDCCTDSCKLRIHGREWCSEPALLKWCDKTEFQRSEV